MTAALPSGGRPDPVALLVPPPHRLRRETGGFATTPAERRWIRWSLEASSAPPPRIAVEVDPAEGLPAAGYRLEIGPERIRIRAGDAAGRFYALCTLRQLEEGGHDGPIPALTVEDAPAFATRGVMLDVSRDRVPTLDTLLAMIDRLSSWKINHLQLYMEHTFAYAGHERVWRDASPFTGEDLRILDARCRERHIELTPNQNSFGHMHRWLVHEPYRQLAECPEGVDHPFSPTREPYGLCPLDPASLTLLEDLYDQLLPHFSSRRFNVGLDETFDLGTGRSRAACEARGKGQVYLDFVREIAARVAARGRQMQMWGDIVLEHPELIDQLPEGVALLEWGYEADHPFERDCARFAAAGFEHWVCPGTSTWNAITGRVSNALQNLASAARAGVAAGAAGYLITDWGDNGHLQPLPFSWPGLLAGACFAWNADAARDPDALSIARRLDAHVFRDAAGRAGAAVAALGDAHRHTGTLLRNRSVLFNLLVFPEKGLRQLGGASPVAMARTREHVDAAMAAFSESAMTCWDAALVRDEVAWAADALRLATRVGAGEAVDRRALRARHEALWPRRSRLGGLQDSAARLGPG